MQRKKPSGAFLVIVAVIMFSCVLLPGLSYADNRYIAQKYSFDAAGLLTAPLTADFGGGSKTAHVERTEFSPERRLLLVAFTKDTDGIFAVQMFGSFNYSIYKVRLRDDRREELVIIGLGKNDGKKVPMQEIRIIGQDAAGNMILLPLRGFEPETVLNSPLQLDDSRAMLFPFSLGNRKIKIYWDAAAESFIYSRPFVGQPAVKEEAEGANIM